MTPTEYRLDDHERRLTKVEEACAKTSVIENEVKHLAREMAETREEFKSVKLALWGLAASLLLAAVTFTLTVSTGLIGG